jgi:hypothetical protein
MTKAMMASTANKPIAVIVVTTDREMYPAKDA